MTRIAGWDIGAVHTKAVLWEGRERPIQTCSRTYEIWREKERLGEVLSSVWKSVSGGKSPGAMAVTMTAELSDIFETKREGVLFVLNALSECFPFVDTYIFSLGGEFVPLEKARASPLDFAASNWLATALWIAGRNPNCLLIDVGSTTTDILPILDGRVCALGRTDFERLACGELVYTGALRTNLAAIVSSIPVAGRLRRVASEYFSISGDVHLILGNLKPPEYTCPTPDGRRPTIDSARARVARLVCADTEMLHAAEIDGIAREVCAAQVRQIRDGVEQVLSCHPVLRSSPAVVLGSGSFLGVEAAQAAGMEIGQLADGLGREESALAPCLAVAQLLAEHLGPERI